MFSYIRFVISDYLFVYGRPIAGRLARYFHVLICRIPCLQILSDKALLLSARFLPSVENTKIIRSDSTFSEKSASLIFSKTYSRQSIAGRALILKNPKWHGRRIEKGIVLFKYTGTFGAAFSILDCCELEKYFYIVLEPSWSGYALPEIHCWTSLKSPIIIECSEEDDFNYIEALNSNLVPVRFGSSDWVDYRVFKPIDGCKPIFDSLYVANFSIIKRHHAYFRAISNLKIDGYKGAIVCGSWGDHKKSVQKMIDYFRIGHALELFYQLSQSELNEILNASRLNVLMSLKEGSNRSIFEGFFANVPGLVLKENIGVNKNYINSETGYLINEPDLVHTLEKDKQRRTKVFSPRNWAMANISPKITTQKLGNIICSIARDFDEPWTVEPAVKINGPEAKYFDSQSGRDLLTGEQLLELFGSNKPDKQRIETKLKDMLLS